MQLMECHNGNGGQAAFFPSASGRVGPWLWPPAHLAFMVLWAFMAFMAFMAFLGFWSFGSGLVAFFLVVLVTSDHHMAPFG